MRLNFSKQYLFVFMAFCAHLVTMQVAKLKLEPLGTVYLFFDKSLTTITLLGAIHPLVVSKNGSERRQTFCLCFFDMLCLSRFQKIFGELTLLYPRSILDPPNVQGGFKSHPVSFWRKWVTMFGNVTVPTCCWYLLNGFLLL